MWGVPALSPDAAEREWIANATVVAQSGAPANPAWAGTRAEKWYRIPGTEWELGCDGYVRQDIDDWYRSWTTAEVVQGIGRLRAACRRDERLEVHIYSMLPLAADHGMRADVVDVDAPWRTQAAYHASRRADAIARARQAAAALRAEGKPVSRRAVQSWLRARGLPGIGNHLWAEVCRAVCRAVLDANTDPHGPSTSVGQGRRTRWRPLRWTAGAGGQPDSHAASQSVGRIRSVTPPRPEWRERVLLRRLLWLSREGREGRGCRMIR